MGAGNSGSNSGGNTGPANRYSTPQKKVADFVKGGGVTGAIVKGISGSIQKSKSKKEANVEIGLGKDRMSNYSTSQGGTKSDGGGGADTLIKIAKLNPTVAKMAAGPTTAEVSQATATEATPTEVAETTKANRLLKIKKRGRSQSIMTSSKGVTKTSANYSLGKPSLLGRV